MVVQASAAGVMLDGCFGQSVWMGRVNCARSGVICRQYMCVARSSEADFDEKASSHVGLTAAAGEDMRASLAMQLGGVDAPDPLAHGDYLPCHQNESNAPRGDSQAMLQIPT